MFFSFPTRDRRLLEQTILPWFAARPEYSRVLFVGCGWYTHGYARLFARREYWTLDNDERQARWGAPRHIVDSLAGLASHFQPRTLDLVVCNGVFGWGLDDPDEVQAAFSACHGAMREGAVLVLGWNDVPAHRPFPLSACESLRRFTPLVFPPINATGVEAGGRNRHRYDFFER